MALQSPNISLLDKPVPEALHKLRILLVEDSPVYRLLLTMWLKQLGCIVRVAGDGLEALSILQLDSSYDMIFMDCQMPLLDGLQATRLIRQLGNVTGQHMPIIGMSAAATAEECFSAGMDNFLHKPLNKSALVSIVRHWSIQRTVAAKCLT